MAITLVTGTPGAGKTLNTIEMVHKRAEKEARAVYYANIDGISFDGWHKMDDIEGASIIHDSKDDPGGTARALVVLPDNPGNRWQTVNSSAGNDLLPSDGVVQAASRRGKTHRLPVTRWQWWGKAQTVMPTKSKMAARDGRWICRVSLAV